ncbi:MAG: sugar transferase [Planctomycetota bacterium]|nr:MAG: sugar transferase [Planctomycetota bacterium]
MAKRLFDMAAAIIGLLLLSPVFLLAFVGIKATSSGPAIYRARRMGQHGVVFVMHKFRTMHVANQQASVITGVADKRVFGFGRLLRATKIDELPQLYDVLTGTMSIVGPRPEDPKIVEQHYNQLARETLNVAPGLASPGSIYNYTHGHLYLRDADPEGSYVRQLLPMKLALELVYLRRQSFTGDLLVIARTAITIVRIALGQRLFAEPPEMAEARQLESMLRR